MPTDPLLDHRAPAASAAARGPQHDNFRDQSGAPHGPQFDEGFNLAAHAEAHGKLFDMFGKPRSTDRYGEQWDEFPWVAVERTHGANYDEDFSSPTANNGEHGTWFDRFDGAAVRYMVEGSDYEGVVTNVGHDHIVVRSREGLTHEVGLGQVLAYATGQGNPHVAEVKEAAPGATDTSVVGGPQGERPSGESSTAMGGHITDRTPVNPSVVDSKFANKSAESGDDVAKDMDSSESAVQAKDEESGQQGNAWCKQCKHYCRKVEGGKCPTCGGPVSVKKDWLAPLDVLKGASEDLDNAGAAKSPSCPSCKTGKGKYMQVLGDNHRYKCQGCGHAFGTPIKGS